MSGRLEEMPGEEGYPAYLASRLAQFYERAGVVECLGQDERRGSVTAIGAVSPPGGDISEPVSQATLRIVKVFWCLDSALAYARHFPAINWLQSYSLYADNLMPWFAENVAPDFPQLRVQSLHLLQEEAELQEIVQLVGQDALSDQDKLKLEVCKSIREDYLHQNSFHEIDTYTSLEKQCNMLRLIISFYDLGLAALNRGAKYGDIVAMTVREEIGRFKYTEEKDQQTRYEEVYKELSDALEQLVVKGESEDD
jgi:V/A-type H+-transporting ATPase subunit A